MNIHDVKDFINTLGFPIFGCIALGFFIFKMWKKQEKTLTDITDTNKQLVETNRNLVDKIVNKVDTLEDKVDSIKDTLEDKIDDIRHFIK